MRMTQVCYILRKPMSTAIAQQTQYILGQLGRFVAWTPSGTQAATVGS